MNHPKIDMQVQELILRESNSIQGVLFSKNGDKQFYIYMSKTENKQKMQFIT